MTHAHERGAVNHDAGETCQVWDWITIFPFDRLRTDHLGVTNASGTLTSQQRYLPFGQIRTDVTTPNPQYPITDLGYTGQRALDPGMGGLMDYHARFYSPALGRFTQPDTLIPDPVNSQAWNRYSYVGNRPINFNDPTGHYACGDGEDRECGQESQIIPISATLIEVDEEVEDELGEDESMDSKTCPYSWNYQIYCEEGDLKIDIKPVSPDVIIDGYETSSVTQTLIMIFYLNPDETHYLINDLNTGCTGCSTYWEFALEDVGVFETIAGQILPDGGSTFAGLSAATNANARLFANKLDRATYVGGRTTSATIRIISPVSPVNPELKNPLRLSETIYEIVGNGERTRVSSNIGNYLIGSIVNAIHDH